MASSHDTKGSGSLLHVFADCDEGLDPACTLVLLDGRDFDARTPAVYSSMLPRPFSVCEFAAAARDVWPDVPAAAGFVLNGAAVSSTDDCQHTFPLAQLVPRVPLPVGTRPPPLRPVPTAEILSRLPGFSASEVAEVASLTSTTTSSTAAAVGVQRDIVYITFAVPGQCPHSVALQEGFHVADALWQLLSDPACEYDVAMHWTVAACPRVFPVSGGSDLFLLTLSALDPDSLHVWIDIRTDSPV